MNDKNELPELSRIEVWQGDLRVAEISGSDPDEVAREAWHYMMQYVEDGPVTLKQTSGPGFALGSYMRATKAAVSVPESPSCSVEDTSA